MATQHYRSADSEPATEAIPVVPAIPAVPAQRSPWDRPATVGETAGARTWTAEPTSFADSAAYAATQAEPWTSTLSRREEGQVEKKQVEKKRRRCPWLTGGLAVGLLLGMAIGQGMGGGTTTVAAPAPAPQTVTVTAPAPAPQTVTVTADPPSPAAAAAAAPSDIVGDGVHQVGTDLPAGRYRTDGPSASSVFPNCYYARLKNDSGEFDAIIANGNLQGPGSVTVRQGEFLELSGGCTWTKA
jgi:hypothetical protein